MWAWKHPHSADGSVSYTELTGDVVFENVTFGTMKISNPEKYQPVCKAWTEACFCRLYRSRKDYDHQPGQSFL